jgi:LysR family glycine cleavage system transcriptional activator
MNRVPPIHLPSIEGLRAIEATSRLGSFERAALELSLTSSAVSKRVITLERLLGISLFTRKANSLELTQAGATYVEQAREVLRMLAAMHRGAHATQLKRLTVTATPTFARQILAPHLTSFAESHPQFDLELIVIAPVPDSPATGADVEIRQGRRPTSDPAVLMQDVVTPMASPKYLQSLQAPLAPSELHRVTRLNAPYESWKAWMDAAGLVCREPDTGPKFQDLGLVYEAAVNGQGVALCRPSLMGDWLNRKALLPLFNIYAEPPGSYYVLPNPMHAEAEQLISWLQVLCRRIAARNFALTKSFFSNA